MFLRTDESTGSAAICCCVLSGAGAGAEGFGRSSLIITSPVSDLVRAAPPIILSSTSMQICEAVIPGAAIDRARRIFIVSALTTVGRIFFPAGKK